MPPIIKYLVVFALFLIIYQLFRAFYHLSNTQSKPKEVVKALVIRIGLSIALFMALILAASFDLIRPHGVVPHSPTLQQSSGNEINKKGATQ
jgi:RsiW-degrading membrane proteinase PrsW (M82 family)|tara:strand:- start:9696 stop:9971 length:276 start_codon:yes stop_codon:yes gene_type:complete